MARKIGSEKQDKAPEEILEPPLDDKAVGAGDPAAGKLTEEEIADLDKAALDEGDALQDKAEQEAPEAGDIVQVQAVFNRMRNPYTQAVFTKHKVTDVIGLQEKKNAWTRDQIAAKVLRIVK